MNIAYKSMNSYGIKNQEQFLFLLGIFFFVLLVTSIFFKAITLYVEVRFTSFLNYSIGKRLVTKYLQQPYSWFLNRNSADLGKTILSEVGFVVSKSVRPMIKLISQSLNVIAIVILLLIANTSVTIVITITLVIIYIIYKIKTYFFIGNERKKQMKNFCCYNRLLMPTKR